MASTRDITVILDMTPFSLPSSGRCGHRNTDDVGGEKKKKKVGSGTPVSGARTDAVSSRSPRVKTGSRASRGHYEEGAFVLENICLAAAGEPPSNRCVVFIHYY